MMDTTFILVHILLLIVGYGSLLVYRRCTYFARRNLPTPPLWSLISGHLEHLWSSSAYSRQLQEWIRQLNAPVYGLFEGFRPLFVSSDVQFLEEVFIKQFSKFNSRRRTFLAHLIGMDRANLSTVEAENWKRLRTVFNPAFSESKLRGLVPKFDKCVEALMTQLGEVDGSTPINIYLLYKYFTMDAICT
jgi:cytochrome P450